MKYTNKKCTLCILSAFLLLVPGCAEAATEVTFSNAYHIYDTSKKYGLIASDDSSLQDTAPYFAADYCVSDSENVGESASSYVAGASGVFNLTTNEVAYAQNIYKRMYPASTTKILTAYLALKYGDLDAVYTVSHRAADQASDSSVCHLKEGDQMTLQQLLYGLLMQSGNDAAVAIAEGMSGSVEDFVELMNEEARAIGALDSHFVNPEGLPDEDHYTTVYDLYLLFQAAIQDERFLDLIQAQEYTVDYIDITGMPVQQVWKSTNKYLLGTEDAPSNITVIGGKTGTTNAAGYCLALLSENDKGEQIVSIVMKADCRNNLYYYMNEILRGFAR